MDFLQETWKMECPDWCFTLRSAGWRPYCRIKIAALLAWTALLNPLAFHSPATWCFAGCLFFAFGKRNIVSGLQRLLRRPEMCSWNSMGGGGTRRELGHVNWSERPCTSAHHSLCQGSWAVWSTWCSQTGCSFHRTLWTWALRTLWAAHS